MEPASRSERGLRGRLRKLTRHKQWLFVSAASAEALLSIAVVDAGYAGNVFGCAVDLARGAPLWDGARMALPGQAEVAVSADGSARARFGRGAARVSIAGPGGDGDYAIDVALGELVARFELATRAAPGALDVHARGEHGPIMTHKRALLPARGWFEVGGRRFELGGGTGGIDLSYGYLPRLTEWRWGFAHGAAQDGRPIAFNLARGNNLGGANENALWWDGALTPLAPARFEVDLAAPLAPWRITTEDGALDLEFRPIGMHREDRNLVLVQSRFAQVLGTYRGTVRDPRGGAAIALDAVAGFAEDQRTRW